MSIKYQEVTIRISELQTQTVTVAPWEVPILQAIYGEGDAQVTGGADVDRDPPGAADEFARLANRYGPKNAETPVVAAVYGKFGPGVAALAEAIEKSAGSVGAKAPSGELSDDQIDAIMAKGDAKQDAVTAGIDDLI
jgi:hypothetical protein